MDDDDIAWIRQEPTQTEIEPPAAPSELPTTGSAPEVSTGPQTTTTTTTTTTTGAPEVSTITTSNAPSSDAPCAPPTVVVQSPPPIDQPIQNGVSPSEPSVDVTPPEVKETPNDDISVATSFDISECERKINEATTEARRLVGELGHTNEKLRDNNHKIGEDVAAQRAALLAENGLHKTIEDQDQVPIMSELPSRGLPRNVESVVISGLQEVSGCVVLPSGHVLVTDNVQGVILFDIEGNVVKKFLNPDWKNMRSPLYHKDHILLLADVKVDGEYLRFIIKFTSSLQYVAKIEGPQWLVGRNVLVDRLSIAHTDYLYLSACGQVSSGIYELSPVGQWTELDFRQSESYVDMVAFATIGPITQLLVVEGRKNYVLQISVRESQVVDRRRMAICERPGALARDDAGRLFVADRASACIHMVDTIKWVSAKNIACTDAVVAHFTASWGLLAIPIKSAVRLQKYSFR